MAKLYLFWYCLFTASIVLPAQNGSWHKYIPPTPFAPNYCRFVPGGDPFLVRTDRALVRLDQLGSVTGHLDAGAGSFWSGVGEEAASGTGHPYFIVARRKVNPSQNFSLVEYRPGVGYVNERTFQDSIPGFVGFTARPVLVKTAANTYVVFGQKWYRKVRYSQTNGFEEEWARPLTVSPVVVLQHQGLFILADEFGRLQALDADGNELWLRQHTLGLYDLKATADGFIGAGNTSNARLAIIKLNADGSELWTKTYGAAGGGFYAIQPTADGGYAIGGVIGAGQMLLLKTDAAGAFSWQQIYPDGQGGTNNAICDILELPQGGYLLLGTGKSGIQLIRTDANGNALAPVRADVHSRFLRTSSLEAEIFPSPTLFFNGSKSAFVSLADSGAATILAFSPWLGGIDPNNELRVAINDYSPYLNSDFRGGTSEAFAPDFNRVWAAKRTEIKALRADFLQNKNLDQPIPFDLLSWPAKGNPNLKYKLDFTPVQTNPAFFTAPFVDANGDGLYNVYDGDYPQLRGDQMVWWAFTDSTAHKRSKGLPLGIDFQVTAFAYDCAQNPILDQSLFVDYDLSNRSSQNYSEVSLGFFTDFDLGCYLDDYIGTLPQQNTWYAYNQDAFDGICSDTPTFGDDIPVQSVSFLNQPLDHSIYFINPSLGPPAPGMNDPQTIPEYYRFLQGRWGNGTPLTSGGSGYNQFSLDMVDHVFPGNPADPQGWTMCTSNLSFADRRVVASHGPFDFAAGDTFRIQLGFTMHSSIPHPCPDISEIVAPNLAQLRLWQAEAALDISPDLAPVYTLETGQALVLDATVPQGSYAWSNSSMDPTITVTSIGNYSVAITAGATGCTQVYEILVQADTKAGNLSLQRQWQVWPNPASNQLYINCPDCRSGAVLIVLYNAQGQLLQEHALPALPAVLPLRELVAGLYWVVLRDESGMLEAKRLMVHR